MENKFSDLTFVILWLNVLALASLLVARKQYARRDSETQETDRKDLREVYWGWVIFVVLNLGAVIWTHIEGYNTCRGRAYELAEEGWGPQGDYTPLEARATLMNTFC